MKKIHDIVANMHHISAKLLRYGLIGCCLLMAGLTAGLIHNIYAPEYSLRLRDTLLLMGEVAVACFALVIIGALIFDFNVKRLTEEQEKRR